MYVIVISLTQDTLVTCKGSAAAVHVYWGAQTINGLMASNTKTSYKLCRGGSFSLFSHRTQAKLKPETGLRPTFSCETPAAEPTVKPTVKLSAAFAVQTGCSLVSKSLLADSLQRRFPMSGPGRYFQ